MWNVNSHWVAFENTKFSKLQGAYAMCTPLHTRAPQDWMQNKGESIFVGCQQLVANGSQTCVNTSFHKSCAYRFCNLAWDKRPMMQKNFPLVFYDWSESLHSDASVLH